MVDLKPEVDRFVNGLEGLGLKKLLEHLSALADGLSNLSVSANDTLIEVSRTLREICSQILAAPQNLAESELIQSIMNKMNKALDGMDHLVQTLSEALPKVSDTTVTVLLGVQHAIRVLCGITGFTQVARLLNDLYSSHHERALRVKETEAKLMHANMDYIRTFFGNTPEAIATTHILVVKAANNRSVSQGACPQGCIMRNILVGGSSEVWSYIQNMRNTDPEVNSLFPDGLVACDTLSNAVMAAENYLFNHVGDEKHLIFFTFHIINHSDPLVPHAALIEPLNPIHVGTRLTESGFCIVGPGGSLGPRVALSVESTVNKGGQNMPLVKYMPPCRLQYILYHGSGYGQGVVGILKKAGGLGGLGSLFGGVTEGAMLKLGSSGLVKLATGKCVAVKVAFPLIAAAPLITVPGLALGWDCWDRFWRHQIYDPVELWSRLGTETVA